MLQINKTTAEVAIVKRHLQWQKRNNNRNGTGYRTTRLALVTTQQHSTFTTTAAKCISNSNETLVSDVRKQQQL